MGSRVAKTIARMSAWCYEVFVEPVYPTHEVLKVRTQNSTPNMSHAGTLALRVSPRLISGSPCTFCLTDGHKRSRVLKERHLPSPRQEEPLKGFASCGRTILLQLFILRPTTVSKFRSSPHKPQFVFSYVLQRELALQELRC